MIRSVSRVTYGAALLAIASLTACSGSGSPLSPIPSRGNAASGIARATFVVHWPSAQQEQTARRHRDAISPSTASITVAVNGGAPYVVNKPTLTGTPSTTSVSIAAPVGTDSFTFLAWDEAGGTGNILDKATTSQAIVANANNTVGVTLDGVCSALVASVATSPYVEATSSTVSIASGKTQSVIKSVRLVGPFAQTVTINEIDPDGNTIVNSAGAPPIALNESGSTPHVTIAPVATTPGNNAFTLTPLVAEPDGFSTTISAVSQNCGSTPTLPNSFALSTSAIVYVADSVAGIIAYDQDGTKLASIATTRGITGLAYNSATPSLVAVEPTSATTGGVTFQTLSLTGTSLGSGTLTLPSGLTNPVGNIAYNASNGNFLAGFREYTDSSSTTHYGTVLEYTISASTAKAVTPTGTSPFVPNGSAPPPYDVDSFAIYPNGNVVVGDSQSDSYLFDKNGNYLNNSAYQTTTLAFDSLRGNVFDFYQPTYGFALNGSLDQTSSFYYPGSAMSPTAAAYNPGTDSLYGFSGKVAFELSSATIYANSGSYALSVLPSGAFAGLTTPTEAVVVP